MAEQLQARGARPVQVLQCQDHRSRGGLGADGVDDGVVELASGVRLGAVVRRGPTGEPAEHVGPQARGEQCLDRFDEGLVRRASSATHVPSRTAAPRRCSSVQNTASSRDFPAPGSPPRKATCRAPPAAAVHSRSSVWIYTNFASADDAPRVAENYGANYERLREVKRRYDPGNLFHLNQNIRP